MTYNEFIQSFNTKFYALTTVDSLGWTEEEICSFLNSAQYKLLNQLIFSKQFDHLLSVIREITIDSFTQDSLGRYVSSLPSDYYHYIFSVASFVKNEETLKVAAEPTEYELLNQFIFNPSNKTLFLQPKVSVFNKELTPGTFTPVVMVVVDSYTTQLTSLTFGYVKKPIEFNSTTLSITDMDLKWHDDIVNIAVEIATSTVIKTGQTSQ